MLAQLQKCLYSLWTSKPALTDQSIKICIFVFPCSTVCICSFSGSGGFHNFIHSMRCWFVKYSDLLLSAHIRQVSKDMRDRPYMFVKLLMRLGADKSLVISKCCKSMERPTSRTPNSSVYCGKICCNVGCQKPLCVDNSEAHCKF